MVAYSSIGHMGFYSPGTAVATPVSLGAMVQMVSRTDLRSAVLAFVGVVYAKTSRSRYPQGLLNPEQVYLWWVACWSWL